MNSSVEIEPTGLEQVDFADALSERYLAYALSTITARSLPDVRDGMKPVHRRLLYAMDQLNLGPNTAPKKSARVVGDVIGKFHPHGDTAVYDAMVRLAQEFAVRYPLVDGQGNFGNIDGDNPAAMRYTEARLTDVARAMLEGLREDAVDFRATYDGDGAEPLVLPAAFPNLLANGSSGIAVGMATNIPPHNVEEVCDACLHLLKHPNASIETLLQHMPGPDFPTGGVLAEDADVIAEAYKTGRGSMRVRATWNVEPLKGGQYQIVVTEIPYQVTKSRLIERIGDLINSRKLVFLNDVRDESAEDIRIVLEPKSRNVEPDVLMEALFRQTELESRFALNMNVLDHGRVPRVMNLREVLQAFLDHRHVVLLRRSRYRLGQIEDRLEVLAGYLVAYLNLDEVIRIIREEDEPQAVLMARFKLTERQAEAILNMRLRNLRKLEEMKIREEDASLREEKSQIEALLADEDKQKQVLAIELKGMKEKFGKKTEVGARRTVITAAPQDVDIPLEATVEKEPVTVVLSAGGWVRALKGHTTDADSLKYKEGDSGRFLLPAYTTDKLLIFATDGRFFTVGVDKLPGGRGFGEPLNLIADIGTGNRVVSLHIHTPETDKDKRLLIASDGGRGFIVKQTDVLAQTKNGRQALNLKDGATAAICTPAVGELVACVSTAGKMLIFPLEELPEMTRGRGVILQKMPKDGKLKQVQTFTPSEAPLTYTSKRGATKTLKDPAPYMGKRAQVGRNI